MQDRTTAPMTFLATLADHLRTAHPEWTVDLAEDGSRLVLEGSAHTAGNRAVSFVLGERDGEVFLEGLWRLPVTEDSEEGIRELLLDVLRDGFENHGWEVPILLVGGPLGGRRVTQPWDDLVGRLVFATKGSKGGRPPKAHFYKWHLRRSPDGDYLCRYERTLEGDEVDAFLRRGVESTGPFVISYV